VGPPDGDITTYKISDLISRNDCFAAIIKDKIKLPDEIELTEIGPFRLKVLKELYFAQDVLGKKLPPANLRLWGLGDWKDSTDEGNEDEDDEGADDHKEESNEVTPLPIIQRDQKGVEYQKILRWGKASPKIHPSTIEKL
jgi:hypothetical protein